MSSSEPLRVGSRVKILSETTNSKRSSGVVEELPSRPGATFGIKLEDGSTVNVRASGLQLLSTPGRRSAADGGGSASASDVVEPATEEAVVRSRHLTHFSPSCWVGARVNALAGKMRGPGLIKEVVRGWATVLLDKGGGIQTKEYDEIEVLGPGLYRMPRVEGAPPLLKPGGAKAAKEAPSKKEEEKGGKAEAAKPAAPVRPPRAAALEAAVAIAGGKAGGAAPAKPAAPAPAASGGSKRKPGWYYVTDSSDEEEESEEGGEEGDRVDDRAARQLMGQAVKIMTEPGAGAVGFVMGGGLGGEDFIIRAGGQEYAKPRSDLRVVNNQKLIMAAVAANGGGVSSLESPPGASAPRARPVRAASISVPAAAPAKGRQATAVAEEDEEEEDAGSTTGEEGDDEEEGTAPARGTDDSADVSVPWSDPKTGRLWPDITTHPSFTWVYQRVTVMLTRPEAASLASVEAAPSVPSVQGTYRGIVLSQGHGFLKIVATAAGRVTEGGEAGAHGDAAYGGPGVLLTRRRTEVRLNPAVPAALAPSLPVTVSVSVGQPMGKSAPSALVVIETKRGNRRPKEGGGGEGAGEEGPGEEAAAARAPAARKRPRPGALREGGELPSRPRAASVAPAAAAAVAAVEDDGMGIETSGVAGGEGAGTSPPQLSGKGKAAPKAAPAKAVAKRARQEEAPPVDEGLTDADENAAQPATTQAEEQGALKAPAAAPYDEFIPGAAAAGIVTRGGRHASSSAVAGIVAEARARARPTRADAGAEGEEDDGGRKAALARAKKEAKEAAKAAAAAAGGAAAGQGGKGPGGRGRRKRIEGANGAAAYAEGGASAGPEAGAGLPTEREGEGEGGREGEEGGGGHGGNAGGAGGASGRTRKGRDGQIIPLPDRVALWVLYMRERGIAEKRARVDSFRGALDSPVFGDPWLLKARDRGWWTDEPGAAGAVEGAALAAAPGAAPAGRVRYFKLGCRRLAKVASLARGEAVPDSSSEESESEVLGPREDGVLPEEEGRHWPAPLRAAPGSRSLVPPFPPLAPEDGPEPVDASTVTAPEGYFAASPVVGRPHGVHTVEGAKSAPFFNSAAWRFADKRLERHAARGSRRRPPHYGMRSLTAFCEREDAGLLYGPGASGLPFVGGDGERFELPPGVSASTAARVTRVMRPPSDAGTLYFFARCTHCGVPRESPLDRCWNEACPLCPLQRAHEEESEEGEERKAAAGARVVWGPAGSDTPLPLPLPTPSAFKDGPTVRALEAMEEALWGGVASAAHPPCTPSSLLHLPVRTLAASLAAVPRHVRAAAAVQYGLIFNSSARREFTSSFSTGKALKTAAQRRGDAMEEEEEEEMDASRPAAASAAHVMPAADGPDDGSALTSLGLPSVGRPWASVRGSVAARFPPLAILPSEPEEEAVPVPAADGWIYHNDEEEQEVEAKVMPQSAVHVAEIGGPRGRRADEGGDDMRSVATEPENSSLALPPREEGGEDGMEGGVPTEAEGGEHPVAQAATATSTAVAEGTMAEGAQQGEEGAPPVRAHTGAGRAEEGVPVPLEAAPPAPGPTWTMEEEGEEGGTQPEAVRQAEGGGPTTTPGAREEGPHKRKGPTLHQMIYGTGAYSYGGGGIVYTGPGYGGPSARGRSALEMDGPAVYWYDRDPAEEGALRAVRDRVLADREWGDADPYLAPDSIVGIDSGLLPGEEDGLSAGDVREGLSKGPHGLAVHAIVGYGCAPPQWPRLVPAGMDPRAGGLDGPSAGAYEVASTLGAVPPAGSTDQPLAPGQTEEDGGDDLLPDTAEVAEIAREIAFKLAATADATACSDFSFDAPVYILGLAGRPPVLTAGDAEDEAALAISSQIAPDPYVFTQAAMVHQYMLDVEFAAATDEGRSAEETASAAGPGNTRALSVTDLLTRPGYPNTGVSCAAPYGPRSFGAPPYANAAAFRASSWRRGDEAAHPLLGAAAELMEMATSFIDAEEHRKLCVKVGIMDAALTEKDELASSAARAEEEAGAQGAAQLASAWEEVVEGAVAAEADVATDNEVEEGGAASPPAPVEGEDDDEGESEEGAGALLAYREEAGDEGVDEGKGEGGAGAAAQPVRPPPREDAPPQTDDSTDAETSPAPAAEHPAEVERAPLPRSPIKRPAPAGGEEEGVEVARPSPSKRPRGPDEAAPADMGDKGVESVDEGALGGAEASRGRGPQPGL